MPIPILPPNLIDIGNGYHAIELTAEGHLPVAIPCHWRRIGMANLLKEAGRRQVLGLSMMKEGTHKILFHSHLTDFNLTPNKTLIVKLSKVLPPNEK